MQGVEYTKYGTQKQKSSNWYTQSEIQLKTSRMFYNAIQSKFQTQKRPWRTFSWDEGITVISWNLVVKSKLPSQSGSSLEAVEPHSLKGAIKF